MKVAVVGGGIFGSVTAYFLAYRGHEVTLYEKNNKILTGASVNNQNRLHLGFHYPRDLETAVQSVKGFNQFKEHFLAACNFDFPCFYGLSNFNSKSTFEFYEQFMLQAGLSHKPLSINEISRYGFETNHISHLWKCNEGVVDNEVLRNLISTSLLKSKVNLSLDDQVTEICRDFDCWKVKSKRNTKSFDVVIRATYGLDCIPMIAPEAKISKSMYQATIVLECELDVEKFGLTVVDGDFLTVLPKGFSNKFLIYAPGPSVIDQSEHAQKVWKSIGSKKSLNDATQGILERFKFYFPRTQLKMKAKKLVTIRNIDANSMKTDRRTSNIEEIAINHYNIRSGKIDHSVLIAQEFVEKFS